MNALDTSDPFAQPSESKTTVDPEGDNAAYSFDGKPDRWKRYRLPDPETGAALGWTRATTFAKSISDTYALGQWGLRMTVEGLAKSDDLYAAACALDFTDKDSVNRVANQAKEFAGAKVGANLGTALHAFSEAVDQGKTINIPPRFRPHVAAWTTLLTKYNMEVLEIEKRVIHTGWEVAGTLDRVVRFTKDTTVQMKQGKKIVDYTFPTGAIAILDLKGLALDTPLVTPTGWTTMGEVQVGDQVIGSDGAPCTVTDKSKVKRIGTYVVKFDGGAEIVCDSEHLWETTIAGRSGTTRVRGIEEIRDTVCHPTSGQKQHLVSVAGALKGEEVNLPIDPYVLGCWLGDGAVRGGAITKQDDLFEVLLSDGVKLGVRQADSRSKAVTRTVLGLTSQLRDAGLLHNKHIPATYLRASFDQRLRLLQGLCDTDGSWNKPRKTAVFSSCDQAFAEQVVELIRTMGERPYIAYYKRKGFGLEVDSWTVEFTPRGFNPFRLPRKADQATISDKNLTMAGRRVIVSVEPGPDVETQCIAVDSPDHLYLCGKEMIPTHNTGRDLSYGWMEIAVQLAVYADASYIFDQPEGPGTEWSYRPQYEGMDHNIALVVHIPAQSDTAVATLYAVDLKFGRETGGLCTMVRAARKRRNVAVALDIIEELPAATIVVPSERADGAPLAVAGVALSSRPSGLTDRVAAAVTVQELASVWFEAMRTRQDTKALAAAIQAKKASLLADSAAG